ncbi:type I secretion system permease/ATPase [Prosthecomicrobium pneumaticum]|uniref:ATP-binding cassette subfamily C protein n=1 Tax=Prosthecomicrobium pneumaticum TaxID=81895 RepID=A0A7W9L264_9HYPH|nr:type I secretion system permease/ATPase [Prosthecomicrobium pneumaticum]MBB5753218.1 ATP-binding cassette subfamily C protein [Prosthecomicrobium pneumaticum]
MFLAGLGWAAILSAFVNILQLTVPLYMLQVHDRVLNSQSIDTLVMLSIAAAGALALYGTLEFIRTQSFQVIGGRLLRQLNLPVLEASIRASVKDGSAKAAQGLRDLMDLRTFMTSPAMAAPLEALWSPIFLVTLFFLHPIYGIVGFLAVIVIIAGNVATDLLTRNLLKEANKAQVDSVALVAADLRHAEAIEAMGMLPALSRRWRAAQLHAVALAEAGNSRAKAVSTITRTLRFGIQVLVLAIGAVLVINRAASPGAMIAASILMGRLLLPFDSVIDNWRSWVNASAGWRRLRDLLEENATARETMTKSSTEGDLVVDRVVYAVPGQDLPILKGVSFSVSPGEVLGIVGPSAAGKSTLARLLVGIVRATAGGVYLDGHNVFLWERSSFGAVVGYLPQQISLLEGTIRDNIARMGESDPRAVIEAARTADVHEMIGRLPLGYDTPIGDGKLTLSGGQRQRIGLARALYGRPRLIVLDEPNASLDAAGETALMRAIRAAKADGAIVVLIAHRPSIMEIADKLLVLEGGRVAQFGPRTDVVAALTPGRGRAAAEAGAGR